MMKLGLLLTLMALHCRATGDRLDASENWQFKNIRTERIVMAPRRIDPQHGIWCPAFLVGTDYRETQNPGLQKGDFIVRFLDDYMVKSHSVSKVHEITLIEQIELKAQHTKNEYNRLKKKVDGFEQECQDLYEEFCEGKTDDIVKKSLDQSISNDWHKSQDKLSGPSGHFMDVLNTAKDILRRLNKGLATVATESKDTKKVLITKKTPKKVLITKIKSLCQEHEFLTKNDTKRKDKAQLRKLLAAKTKAVVERKKRMILLSYYEQVCSDWEVKLREQLYPALKEFEVHSACVKKHISERNLLGFEI